MISIILLFLITLLSFQLFMITRDVRILQASEVQRLLRLSKGDDKFKILSETNTNLVLKVRELERLAEDSSKIIERSASIIEVLTETVQNNTSDLDKLLKPKKSKKKVVKKKVTKKKGVNK